MPTITAGTGEEQPIQCSASGTCHVGKTAPTMPNICPIVVPQMTMGAKLFLFLLLSCMVLSSFADSSIRPYISVPPRNQEVMYGGSVNLTCRALGEPLPYVKWMKNKEVLTNEYVTPHVQNVLKLSNIRESANYTCVAMSSLGFVFATAEVKVKDLPSFIKSPIDQTAISGGVASFVCQATGEPKPRITWTKNAQKIILSTNLEVIEYDNGSGSVLRIQDLNKEADEGIYECTATNSVGESNDFAKLIVLKEPQTPHGFPTIDIDPQLRVVEESRSTVMSCSASGNPDPVISWYKDKLPLDINRTKDRIRQFPSGSLQIDNSEKSDQGSYECVAMNSAGIQYSAPAKLYVRDHWTARRSPPRISLPPTNQEVELGGSVNLTCAGVGSPKPFVKWMKGREQLTPEEDMPVGINVLELTNIRESAVYTCVALNILGTNEAKAEVKVTGQPAFRVPRFTKIPKDQSILGGVVSFVCQATGEPKPTITWWKKGKKISPHRAEVFEFDDGLGSVLRIEPIRANRDDSEYECMATNSVGEVSTSVKLTVLKDHQIPHGFPTIDRGPQLMVVETNQTAFMPCAVSGNPAPEIYWYKDLLPLDVDSSDRHFKRSTGSLQIKNAEESDAGRYECVAVNRHGTRYSSPANLYVREQREVRKVPPRFSIPLTNREVVTGGSVNLTCVAVGSPMPYVKWTMGTKELTPEEEIPIGRNILELTNIRESANYTCVAMSRLGVIHATAQVTVKGLPIRPTSVAVTETTATSITLTWDYESDEPLSYYMILYRAKNSDSFHKLTNVLTLHYNIDGLSPNTKYEFRVAAVNEFGQGPASDPVETQTRGRVPTFPSLHVRARVLDYNIMLVQWEPLEEPDIQIKGYRVYYSTDPDTPLSEWQQRTTDDRSVIAVSGLNLNFTYSVRVQGFSSGGDGPLSDILQVKMHSAEITPPSILEVKALNSTAIHVIWKPPVMEEGQLRGYRVVCSRLENGEPQGSVYTLDVSLSEEAVIGGLESGTTYSVRVNAFIIMGHGTQSQPKVVTTTV